MRFRAAALVVVVVVPGLLAPTLGCEILATNPLDPDTNPEFQQRATLNGSVRAVLAPDDDGSVPEPGPCAAVADGDHSGFIVVLRGLADTGDGVAEETQETNASGGFEFKDVPAGSYVVDVVRAGFRLPPPTELTLDIGDERVLPPLCAINASPPAPPLVTPPPALVDGSNRPAGSGGFATVNVNVAPGLTYRIIETPEGGAVARDEVLESTLVLLVLDATPGVADDEVRQLWRVDVVAVDALGNVSAPTSFLVVKDGLAPQAPAVAVVAGRDRLQVSLDVGVVAAGDDAPASFLVAYAVVAPDVDDLGCPFGAPRPVGGAVDPVVHGSFAVEGPSPIAVTSRALTLSGLQAGTELVVLAAAVDAAGNASCWSAPLDARPDVVTFAPRAPIRTVPLGGGVQSAETDGAIAFARGDAGLVVIDREARGHTIDDAPASDVAALGETLLVASGVLGLRTIELDDVGVPGLPRTIELGGRDAVVVAARPGRALVGGPEGLTSVDLGSGAFTARALDGDDDGAITGLAGWGSLLLVVRDGNEKAIEVHRLADVDAGAPGLVGRVTVPVLPSDLVVVDDRVWVTQGALGVAVIDVSSCADVDDDCAVLVAQRSLRAGAVAKQLAPYDDAVLVTDDRADLTVATIAGGAVRLLGVLPGVTGARVNGVAALQGSVCVGVDDVGGSQLECATTVQAPLVDEERRLAPVDGQVTRIAHALGQGVHARQPLQGPALASVYGFDDGAIAATVAADGNLLTAALPGVGFVVGDVLLRHDGTSAALDVSGALEDAGLVAPFVGFGVIHGDRLALAVVAQGSVDRTVVLTARLVEAGGVVDLAQVEVRDLASGVDQVSTAVRRRGRVFFGTSPFGLFSVDVDGGAVRVEQALESSGRVADVGFLARVGLPDQVVVAGQILEGGAPRERLFPVVDGVLDRNGGLAFATDTVRGMTVFDSLLVVSTQDDGAVFVDDTLRPVLQVPSVSQVGQTLATARGLLCADGAAGTAWLVIR
ncbi:MAG: hypothetical protein Q8O67_23915 [Deltaproteobacteria bacterium]|nr:hypothetical protein [Deltaproteobacteria bacterium]